MAVPVRNLVLVLGDQLNQKASAFDGFDTTRDAVMMTESREEASYVPQHQQRLVLFFSAMRHFRDELIANGKQVEYGELGNANNRGTLALELERRAQTLRPERIIVTEPGDYRVLKALTDQAKALKVELVVRPDCHFIDSIANFQEYASARKELLLENYYRRIRRQHGWLMNQDKPVGGKWNFDADNRKRLPAGAGRSLTSPNRFAPDDQTREVIALVKHHFPDSPGDAGQFAYPVTREAALSALDDFITQRLPYFGDYQDAMTTTDPFLFHSVLSSSLNLHLLDPREVIEAACAAYESGDVPLNAAEGFVRQIAGWREYVRGIYWWAMPRYAELNALNAQLPMPAFMWTAETEMNCVRHAAGQLADHAYAHHIQRLMVLGLFSMLLGVRPYEVHRWHMSMNIDAVDWVSLPNVLGMSQYGDGGVVGTKPYCASGNYIKRMGNYCQGCRFNPAKATGDDACPITTLYWDFLDRHRDDLAKNHRMGFQYRNLDRKDPGEVKDIRRKADSLKVAFTSKTYL